MDLVDALKRELAALESDLETDPRYRKIARIRSLLAEYSAMGIKTPERSDVVTISIRKRHAPVGDTKRARIHRIIHNHLRDRPKVHRKAILNALQDDGLLAGDKDPMGALAAYLSSFPDFRSAGGGFWELASLETDGAPADAGAPKSSDSGVESLFRETADHDR
jgi:hypothetical protein